MMENRQWIQTFGCGLAAVSPVAPEMVGNKAASLIRMADAGLSIPAGFVITTALCREYFEHGGQLPGDFPALLGRHVQSVERATGLHFGGRRRPLLVSVRSGAPVSMPGMLETILNVGLCDRTLPPLIRQTGNPRFAWDSYHRLVRAFGEVLCGLPAAVFDRLVEDQLRSEAALANCELDVFAMRSLTQQFLRLYAGLTGEPFPQEPLVQLILAIEAVLHSWNCPRAVEYRRLHGIDDGIGTAVTVQTMVFGNMGGTSGAGVAFTRDPSTGERELYADMAWNAQGEDVVSGRQAVPESRGIRRLSPALDGQLRQLGDDLEQLFLDAQDFEFTVQEGRLHLLQSRAAARTPWAALRMACDMVKEGLIDEQAALQRLARYDLSALRMTRLASQHACPPLSIGVAASPGVAVGKIALEPATAVAMASDGCRPILVRRDILTDDLAGLAASEGILTTLGGRTSHAAVVARQMNKVCIVGCSGLTVEQGRRCRIGGQSFTEGDFLSLDGNTGAVYPGQLEVVAERPVELISLVDQWRQSIGHRS